VLADALPVATGMSRQEIRKTALATLCGDKTDGRAAYRWVAVTGVKLSAPVAQRLKFFVRRDI
jgi:hypothetical protein